MSNLILFLQKSEISEGDNFSFMMINLLLSTAIKYQEIVKMRKVF